MLACIGENWEDSLRPDLDDIKVRGERWNIALLHLCTTVVCCG